MFRRISPRTGKGGKQRGFTLIELIIVMTILALLAVLTVPKFAGVLKDKDKDIDNASLKMLQTAVELYAVDKGEYPETLDELEGEYFDEIPKEQQSGNEFDYDSEKGKVFFSPKQGD